MDTFDELAAIFLTEDEDAPAPEPMSPAQLELILVGHLPVRAGLWLTPYADASARQRGPTALIDLDKDRPRVQLLRHRPQAVGDANTTGLREVVGQLARDTRCWVIRPPHDVAMDQLVALPEAQVTILSGTSQTAVVHAYRIIRSLVEAAQRLGQPLGDLGVALVGADSLEADEVGTRLVNAASTFLDITLTRRPCLPRIDAGVICTGELALPQLAAPEPATIVEWIRCSTDHSSDQPIADGSGELHKDRTTEMDRGDSAVAEVQTAPAPHQPHAEPDCPSVGGWGDSNSDQYQIAGAVQPAKITPKTVTFVEPKASPAPAQPQERGRPVPLARFVEGLTPLPVRCPRLERIELAVDQSSGLHLLGREADLRDMHVVQVWAREQRELLDQACRPIRIDAHSQPVCHVFTDVPASLADLHRSDLKLHVLTPVAVDDRVAWYCAPLK
jgi:hypothetical protein